MAFSRSVAGLREAGWLAGTVTVGQAFGGDLEAVNLHTGLLAAAHVLHADVAVVAQGPGNLGTGSPWGTRGWRPARRSTPRPCSGGGPSPPCASPRPTSGAPPRHLPPQPDGVRAGGHGAGGHAGPGAGRGVRRTCPGTGRGPRRDSAGRLDCARSTSPAWLTLWPQARCGCRPWVVALTRTRHRSCCRGCRSIRRDASDSLALRGRPDSTSLAVFTGPSTTTVRTTGPVWAQRASTRSTTKISVSPGLIAPPAPRSP